MVTTTSTSTTPATTAKSTSSVNKSAAQALLSSLNSGSGVDTSSLVASLVDAQFAAKQAQLSARGDTLKAQISGVATLKSTVKDFTSALETLVRGGTLGSQPVSSNTATVTATALTGAKLSGLSSTIEVKQLASAQVATSAKNGATAALGTGTLTLRLGTASYADDGTMTGFAAGDPVSIEITSGNNTLAGIASAINTAKAGVTASVVKDADGGAYLSLKGASGAAQAFTLSAGGDLAQFAVELPPSGNGMKVASQPKNAQLVVDGVKVERASNEIADVIDGVKLNLTQTGTTTLSASRSTAALTNAVNDFVATYNQVIAAVKEQTDPIDGQLRADPAAKTLLRQMQAMVAQTLLPSAESGSPASLAAIGVRTNRDGTLSVDDAALTRAMTQTPDAVEAMFAYSPLSDTGLFARLRTLNSNASIGLGKSTEGYVARQSEVKDGEDKMTTRAAAMTTRLTQQFSSMNARVAAYKATQSFMQQQIDNWAKSTG